MSYTITQVDKDLLTATGLTLKYGFNLSNVADVGSVIPSRDNVEFSVNSGVDSHIVKAGLIYGGGFDDFGNPKETEQLFLLNDLSSGAFGEVKSSESYIRVFAETGAGANLLFNQNKLDELVVAGVSLYINSVPVAVGDLLKSGDVLTLTANPDKNILLSSLFGQKTGQDMFGDPTYKTTEYPLQLETDNKKATLTIANDDTYTQFTVQTEADNAPVVEDKNGFTNIYSLTDVDVVNVLTNSIWADNSGVDQVDIDGRNYIQHLYKLPFELDPAIITGKSNVYLYNHDTGVNVDYIKDEILNLSAGKILVTGKGDLTDITNKTAVLHLPYVNSVDINLASIIDNEIDIQYKINLYTGDCSVYVVDLYGRLIAKQDGLLGATLPYTTAFLYSDALKYGDNDGLVLNDIRTAYIEVLSLNDDNSLNSMFLSPILDNGIIDGLTGFIKFNDIDLKIGGVKGSILNQLKNLLQSGVIVK